MRQHGCHEPDGYAGVQRTVRIAPDFASCVSNGPCLSEPPPGEPFCGSFNLPYCPQPIPCGYPNTIPCPGMMGPPGVPCGRPAAGPMIRHV
ncbi:MAG: hypothetical protein IPH22_13150 [Nitrosomonas sp.]|nr:hypothetical protein [Nitrosomonas sp.]